MTWKQTRQRVQERAGVPQRDVDKVLTALLAEIGESLVGGERVSLPGIGTLGRRWRPERVFRSIQTAQRRPVDAAWTPSFRASSVLKRKLKELTPSKYSDPDQLAAWRLAETLIGDLDLYHQDKLPILQADATPGSIREQCAAAFGMDWEQAVAEYERRHRVTYDHLSASALRLWGQ